MEECNLEAIGAAAWSLVDEADAFAVAHGQGFADTVFYLEGYMVHASAAIVEVLLHGALGAGGLEELELHFTDLKEGGLHFLVFDNFGLVDFKSEDVLEIGEDSVDALYGDAQVFNA